MNRHGEEVDDDDTIDPDEEDLEEEDDDEVDDDDEGEDEADGDAEGEADDATEPAATFVPQIAEAGGEDDEFLRSELSPEVYAAIQRSQRRMLDNALTSMSAANIHLTTAAAASPDLFREYGSRIQHNISQLAPELRQRPESVNVAVAGVLLDEAKTHGLPKALAKMARLIGDEAPVAKGSKRVAIPPTQRPPTASSRGGTRPDVKASRIKALMRDYDLNRSEAEAMLGEVSRPSKEYIA